MSPITHLLRASPEKSAAAIDPYADIKKELSRLIHAAVINKRFREMLLDNPTYCIETGFCGESFHFPSELNECIQNINAGSLEDFSYQFLKVISSPNIHEMAILHYQ